MNDRGDVMTVPLSFGNIDALPLIHGDLAFALEARRRMLSERYRLIAVELPPSLKSWVEQGIDALPVIHAVVYRDRAWASGALDDEGGVDWSPEREEESNSSSRAWYVPIDPCDGIVEALRVARGERTEVRFIDAEIEQFEGRRVYLPDAHAIGSLGMQAWYDAVRPTLDQTHPATAEDRLRERHMAAELRALSAEVGDSGRILFLGGLAHWRRIRDLLGRGDGDRYDGVAPLETSIELIPIRHDSMFHVLGEIPLATWFWEQHRAGFSLDDHDPAVAVPRILETARAVFAERHSKSLDRPTTASLAALVDFARKLTLFSRRLIPDLYTLVVAAKGTVGNDFALAMLEASRTYPPNRLLDGEEPIPGSPGETRPTPGWVDGLMEADDDLFESASPKKRLETTGTVGRVGDEVADMTLRTPGAWRELKPIKLQGPPPEVDRRLWQTVWNPHTSCSWPPEDIVIENFRNYLSTRALTLAGLERQKVEEFTASMKDGLALRETLRDLPMGRIFVKEEPRVPGRVGAVVMIFEEDDFGARYPWRLTWQAEHENESSLAFYATDFRDDLVGPGVARAIYGGCMLLFPPQPIPCVWEDLRFERARTPSERLLLAALWYSADRYVAHLAEKPPSSELQESAARLGKHIVHLPISSMSRGTLEKLRRFHVLNGHQVRSWAARFIR